ncbi:MAG TPA: cytidylate kinase-like family protein [Anaerolineaceae bacterium]|nr:cytidylate kinase-like family protein [Anaerolineaceae bacterium]
MSVITISRQYGSLGNEIAARTCEILGYRLFDRALMAHLASRIGLSEDEVVDYSESNYKAPTILNQLISLLTTPPGEAPAVTQSSTWQRGTTGAQIRVVENVNENRGVLIVSQTILAASQVGNVVIVGRAGQAVLQQTPGVLHVRIEAPLDVRAQRVQEQENLSPQEAQRQISRKDKASGYYVKHFYGLNWSDSSHYHLVINTGKWDVEAAAKLIVDAVGLLKT